VPEGGRGAITDVNESNRTISRQLLTNDFPKVGGGRGRVIGKHGVIEEKPILPGSLHTSIHHRRVQPPEKSYYYSMTVPGNTRLNAHRDT
jgi:hypothetical protein